LRRNAAYDSLAGEQAYNHGHRLTADHDIAVDELLQQRMFSALYDWHIKLALGPQVFINWL
jgi:hypothetical protein